MDEKNLKIIISPAKKMKERGDLLPHASLPVFLEKTEYLLKFMRDMDFEQLQSLWKCNDKIAQENFERIRDMDMRKRLTPAILAYEGIQYKYMSPAVFDEAAYRYLENHLYILSGFYGALRPFDGVTPYRLEMQARFHRDELDSLYDFWGISIAEQVFDGCSGMVNLASKEYSKCVTKYLPGDLPCVTCVFGELINGKVKEKGTYAKMARGEMVRFMAEEKIEELEGLKKFDRQGYHYAKEWSDEKTYVFLNK
ncbi:MAG: peroxide stress protein YaaA [Lachnospiraceae bacterium]|nr:peroxide stress protein YaaA [Lachnospiraceae bacterium]